MLASRGGNFVPMKAALGVWSASAREGTSPPRRSVLHGVFTAPSALRRNIGNCFPAPAASPSAGGPLAPVAGRGASTCQWPSRTCSPPCCPQKCAERMLLRTSRRDFFGAGLQPLKPARNRASQWRLPSKADEPPGGALSRRGPVRPPTPRYWKPLDESIQFLAGEWVVPTIQFRDNGPGGCTRRCYLHSSETTRNAS
jgi:hypothetical protein